MTGNSLIRTPDQRLRVFISSTINELAAERKAARTAIEQLRLTPVFFESGARPHPPQDLYRAYLKQSDVFIGIYASSYGWVAPGAQISGIEDEYQLSAEKPRLIYVKNSETREPKLRTLLTEIQGNATVCYQRFDNADQLAELLQNDLALLLAERFDASGRIEAATTTTAAAIVPKPLPLTRGKFIGRERELVLLRDWLADTDTGLITLTGAGGIGKSRLGLQLAHDVCPTFEHGCAFIPLASVSDDSVVAATIARTIGLFDSGHRAVADLLAEYLADKSMLLVLDNFEHVAGAANVVSGLLGRCPRIRIVATSRAPLHLRGERIFPVPPLDIRCDTDHDSSEQLLQCPALQLFIQRAREVDPDIDLSPENIQALAVLCMKLDGLPLAIELAAARSRYLNPIALKNRVDRMLDLLSGGARDLPERQRTMRATIAWSHDLLDDAARALFRRLAVFADSWSLDSAAYVARGETDGVAVLEDLQRLVDLGLVRRLSGGSGPGEEPQFTLLNLVRSFASEQLDSSGERKLCDGRHADYFTNVTEILQHAHALSDDGGNLARIERVFPDARNAFRYWISAQEFTRAMEVFGNLRPLWVYKGMVSEALSWVEAVGINERREDSAIPARIRGRALVSAGLILSLKGVYARAADYLRLAAKLFEQSSETGEQARATTYVGLTLLSLGDKSAVEVLTEAAQLGRAAEDDFATCLALAFLSEAQLIANDAEGAARTLDTALQIKPRGHAGAAVGSVLLHSGNLKMRAGDFVAAAETYRESIKHFDAVNMRPIAGWTNLGLGYASFRNGNIGEARQAIENALSIGRATGDDSMIASSLLGMALLAESDGQVENSAMLMGAAEQVAKSIGYSFWSTDQLLYRELKDRLTRRATGTELTVAEQRGRELSRHAVLELATGN